LQQKEIVMRHIKSVGWFERDAYGAEFWAYRAYVQSILKRLDFAIAGYAVTCENGALADAAGDIEADLEKERSGAVSHDDVQAFYALDNIAPDVETVVNNYVEAKLASMVQS
jgi:hypothetical protein